jgi:uncharacterized protein (TIGR03000 family)
MYSVVLLMAISGGADVPASHFGDGCYGGGCYGGGCYGGGACYGGGGGCHGGGHRLFGGGGGCHGGGHRLFGGGHRHACHGGGGCYGGGACYGGGCYGGGYYGACYGGGACYGCVGGVVVPSGEKPKDMPKPGEKPKDEKPKDKEGEVSLSAPATIIVSLPAEAKLTIDDAATTSTGAVRTFVSPNLDNGRDYHYDLKAEVDGKTLTKRITVRAGEETRVEIDMASLAAK